jgi:hypothetical protein
MALVSFPDGSYLELIAPQANAAPDVVEHHPWASFLTGNAGPSAPAISIPKFAVCAPPASRYRLPSPMAASGPMVSASNGRSPFPARVQPAAFSPF